MASDGKKTTPRARIKTADLMELFSERNYTFQPLRALFSRDAGLYQQCPICAHHSRLYKRDVLLQADTLHSHHLGNRLYSGNAEINPLGPEARKQFAYFRPLLGGYRFFPAYLPLLQGGTTSS